MGFLSRDSEPDEMHILVNYDAIDEWQQKITADFRREDWFNLVQYDPTDSSAIQNILSDHIDPYLQEDVETVMLEAEQDIDIPATLGVNLGVAIGGAVDEYVQDDEEIRETLGEDVLDHVGTYMNEENRRADYSLSTDEFQWTIRIGYNHYDRLRDEDHETPYDIEVNPDTRLVVHSAEE